MELVDGPGSGRVNNLYRLLHAREEHLPPRRALRIATQVAAACAYLHAVPPNGIVHRDLKSPNILIDRRYNAKVTDFGCGKLRRTLRTVMSVVAPRHHQLFGAGGAARRVGLHRGVRRVQLRAGAVRDADRQGAVRGHARVHHHEPRGGAWGAAGAGRPTDRCRRRRGVDGRA